MTTSGLDKLLTWVLFTAVVASLGVVAYLTQVPPREEPFTELYLLGKDGIAEDYFYDLRVGRGEAVIMGITNHEGAPTQYMVEVYAAKETINNATNRSEIVSMRRLGTVPVELADGQTYEQPYEVVINEKGPNKLEFLLFKANAVPPESVSGADRVRAAYRNVNLWIAVH
ncbi:MAG TPA: DUF1616 domain-containing protein [Methanoregulaceae archaeon]|nr:DUF1616 domain-containing protein [Methanoregulaceae archaeon]HQJ88302.1 DUF1616 domain-containing protein [Methanoregulaceae archaeon]